MTKLIRIEEIKISLNDDESILQAKVIKLLGIKKEDITYFKITKKAIDSRNKKDILFIYSIDLDIKNIEIFFNKIDKLPNRIKSNIKKHRVRLIDEFIYEIKKINKKPKNPPVIIGSGPAGLYAGLIMAEAGLNPIIIERGKDVDSRIKDVDIFSKTGKLDTNSNIQFGEGGAGTFSDGKLYTLINDPRSKYVFSELIKAGAPTSIAYDAKPHIGTDYLRVLVKVLREKIISLGGKVRFETCMTGIEIVNNKLEGIILDNKEKIKTEDLIVAIGHSARDTVTMLFEKGVEMKAKPFAMCVKHWKNWTLFTTQKISYC